MEKPFKHYGMVILTIICGAFSLTLLLISLHVHFADIISKTGTTYDNYNKLAVSSNYNDNTILDDTSKPVLSVVSYVVDKGNYDFDYFGKAYCNGIQLTENCFNLDKDSLSGDQIKLEIYVVNENGLYDNLKNQSCLNIRDEYFNVPEGFKLISDNHYSFMEGGTSRYAVKIDNKYYRTDADGIYVGEQLNVTPRIASRGTYTLKYVVTNAYGMQESEYINVIIN